MALFHALGTTRLQAGTVCDTCADVAWEMTCGSVGGADPEAMVHSDLIVSWSADLVTTAVHIVGQDRGSAGAGRAARGHRAPAEPHGRPADWHVAAANRHRRRARPRPHARARLGTGWRIGTTSRARRSGSTGSSGRCCPDSARTRVAAITGLPRGRRRAPRPSLRPGAGAVHPARDRDVPEQPGRPGRAGRSPVCPPSSAPTGSPAAARFSRPSAASASRFEAVRRPSGPAATRLVNHSRLGQALLELGRPADPGALRLGQQPGRDVPGRRERAPGAHARGPLHGRS